MGSAKSNMSIDRMENSFDEFENSFSANGLPPEGKPFWVVIKTEIVPVQNTPSQMVQTPQQMVQPPQHVQNNMKVSPHMITPVQDTDAKLLKMSYQQQIERSKKFSVILEKVKDGFK